MSKGPPDRIRVLWNMSTGKYHTSNTPLKEISGEYNFTEHFYSLDKPLEQNKDNLTLKEAWLAMANGECVKACNGITYKINNFIFSFWDDADWLGTTTLPPGFYTIVPDPSKSPVSEYEKNWDKLTDEFNLNRYIRNQIKFILETYFVMKPKL